MFKLFKGNTLYFPGCLTKKVYPEIEDNYKKILEKSGIDFIMLEQQFCCGSPPLNAGYEKDFLKLAEKNLKTFEDYSIKKVITNCPACYGMLKEYEKHFPKRGVKVEYITTIVLKAIKKGKLKLKKVSGRVTYHDPCHLGRYAQLYEDPRTILKKMGYTIIEMQDHHAQSLCCGGGAGVASNRKKLGDKMSEERLKQAKKTRAKMLVTTCPLCTARLDNPSVKVKEFSQALIEVIK
ncbi:MAG: (Fe-S)-binding protein [Nanoarchaeota archaeon]|nr:(Fe-S)-binding protein [Nanoarchaeota archaeon]